MILLQDVLLRLGRDLEALRLRWALIGGRPRDLEDSRNLIRTIEAGELQRAAEMLELIQDRGFQPERDRDLGAELARLVESQPS